MLKELLAAFRFLTILPIGKAGSDLLSRAPLYFPAAGLVIGLWIASFDAALFFLPLGARSALTVLALAMISGGLHLDGAADATDGLLSGKGREDVLRIMRDPRAGPMGVMAVVFIVLLKTAALNELALGGRFPAIVGAALLGRCALTVTMAFFGYARQAGLASPMAAPSRVFAIGVIVFSAVLGAWRFGWRGIGGAAVAYGAVLTLGWGLKRKIGGYTGDTLGLACELAETAALLTLVS